MRTSDNKEIMGIWHLGFLLLFAVVAASMTYLLNNEINEFVETAKTATEESLSNSSHMERDLDYWYTNKAIVEGEQNESNRFSFHVIIDKIKLPYRQTIIRDVTEATVRERNLVELDENGRIKKVLAEDIYDENTRMFYRDLDLPLPKIVLKKKGIYVGDPEKIEPGTIFEYDNKFYEKLEDGVKELVEWDSGVEAIGKLDSDDIMAITYEFSRIEKGY